MLNTMGGNNEISLSVLTGGETARGNICYCVLMLSLEIM